MPRTRTLLIGLTVLAVVAIGIGGLVLTRGGDTKDGADQDVRDLATHLVTTNGLNREAAECVARHAVRAVGPARLQSADLSAGTVPDDVRPDFIAAVAAGLADCSGDVQPVDTAPSRVAGAASADPDELAKAVSGLSAYYAEALGVSSEAADCIASTVVGWQAGPEAVPGGADKPLADALEECGISSDLVGKDAPVSPERRN